MGSESVAPHKSDEYIEYYRVHFKDGAKTYVIEFIKQIPEGYLFSFELTLPVLRSVVLKGIGEGEGIVE